MADSQRRNWTEDETTLALDLYRKIPFGKIDSRHPDIIELAGLINRTPSAVAQKMCNLAALDPVHINRGVRALTHGSKLDPVVYSKYDGHLGELAFNAAKIRARLENQPIESYLINASDLPLGEDQEETAKTRMGADTQRRNWTEDETALALEMYLKIPFGKISSKHPDVVGLSELINRSPSAVAKKMFNLAALDPVHINRGVKSLSHGSKLDSIVYAEYAGRWGELAFKAIEIKSNIENKPIENYLVDSSGLPLGENRERIVKTRVGQDFFRKAVLASYGNKCCITGMDNTQMLMASHIKPWSQSSPEGERTNPCNGLALNSFHDRAFDQGLITVDLDYKIRISDKLTSSDMDEATQRWIASYAGALIRMPRQFKPCQEFLEYHNDVIFKK